MGLGNINIEGPFREEFKDYDFENPFDACGNSMPGIEYKNIGLLAGNFITALRVGIRNRAIMSFISYMNVPETIIFWLVWYFAIFSSNIIILKWITAQVYHVYGVFSKKINLIIEQERAALISESEIIDFN